MWRPSKPTFPTWRSWSWGMHTHRCPFVSVLSAFGVFVCMEMAGCWGISEIILSINREAALLFSLTLFTFLLWFSCSIRVLPWMDSHTERIFFSFVLYILLYILRFIFHFIYCPSFPVGLLSWLRVVRQTECFCYNWCLYPGLNTRHEIVYN